MARMATCWVENWISRKAMIRYFTKSEDDILTRLCCEGKTCVEMGQILDRSESSVYRRKSELRLITKDAKTHALLADPIKQRSIKEGRDTGKTYATIAGELGYSVNAVETVCKRNGWKLKQPKRATVYPPEVINLIKYLNEVEGKTQDEIIQETRLSRRSVQYICTYHRIKCKHAPRGWRQPETERMVKMLDGGILIDEISSTLNRSDVAIIAKCEKLKIAKRYPTVMERKTQNKHRRYTLESALKAKLKQANKSAAIKRGLDVDIDLPFLVELFNRQQGKCHYTGRFMSFIPSHPDTFSIDRIDSNRGYVRDNVVLCLWTINRMKQELELPLFLDMCRIVTDRASVIAQSVASMAA